ncbi:cytochrome P450 2K4-like isoform X2 [Pseudophryne corroboree]|uniref:cytochrome P450 2K4-like isoform X2 n=1 Tax=Pseudophryne corroboree TaxID=495146 RepID=UPI0030812100
MDLGLSVATYFVLILVLLYILHRWNKTSSANFPPGPKCWPLIGNLHIMDLNRPHKTYLELAKTYGSVFSVQMGMKKMVVLAGYEAVKDALINHAEEFGERGIVKMLKDMDKEKGLISSNGENWKVMRRFTITTLRDFGMGKSTIEDKIAEESVHLTNHIASFKGKQFDDLMILNAAVANIIVAILLGHRMSYEDPQFKRLLSLTNENVRLLGAPMVSDAENSQTYFHNDNLRVLVRNLFTAGMETTSTTLSWGLLLMVKYPKIQEKVQEEISRVVGSAQPLYSHRGQMPFTYAVVHEIQRFSDIIPLGVIHETSRDVTFKGYFIPKGTFIIPLLTSVLKDKTQFEKPDEFYPNHFLDAKGNFIKKDAFLPFSAGRRVCAGENLARMELFIFFTSLLQKFTFCLPPGIGHVNMTPGVGITSTPMKQMICAVPRF